MLRTAFIGNENFYDYKICEWLSEHTDLSLIIWTDKMGWSYPDDGDRRKRVVQRFVKRSNRYGKVQAIDELLYYVLYRTFIAKKELTKVKDLVDTINFRPKTPLSEIKQIRPEKITSEELQQTVESSDLDAMFAMCIDVYLPQKLINTPRYGTFLWHEGITPNYRGVYSPFWALVNDDYENLGYTLLKMNSKLDAGEIYLQGKVENIDVMKDWHSYIGHKAVLDSLPETVDFLKQLESNQHTPIDRNGAEDGYYSYPTASALIKLALKRYLPNRKAAKNGI